MAMILAAAALLETAGTPDAARIGSIIREAVFAAIYEGIRTSDLGGHWTTSGFTDEIIRRVAEARAKANEE